MGEGANSSSPLWLPEKDKTGTVLKKHFARAAVRGWHRMRDYAARERVDSSFAADIVESIVKSMSAVRRRKRKNKVRNPESYIFARFTRRIRNLLSRERRIEYVGTVTDLDLFPGAQDWEWPLRLENAIQASEAISYMDRDTRRTYWRRMQGYSWKRIAQLEDVRVNTAIKRYKRGLQRTKERMQVGRSDDPAL